MSAELAEEYDRLTRPDFYREADALWKRAVDSGPPMPGAEELEAAWRSRVKEKLAAEDQGVLRAAGITLDDFVSLRAGAVSRRRGGNMLPQDRHRRAVRKTVLLAIREADLSSLGWTETIDAARGAAQEEHGSEPDRKTVDAWLRVLHNWGLIEITPPAAKGRGRPPKKE